LPGIGFCGYFLWFRWRATAIEKQQRINEQIKVSKVLVIDLEGNQLGILNIEDAIARAREVELDLVEVATPADKPPVCRIMDFGKFKYQQNKKTKKGHVHHVKNKEIRLRPKIGKHDLDFKVQHAREFLEHKDKVLISVIFRGRENAHVDEGFKVVKAVIADLAPISVLEQGPSLQGRRIVAILAPK
jgi:translation initiation factor IF-3